MLLKSSILVPDEQVGAIGQQVLNDGFLAGWIGAWAKCGLKADRKNRGLIALIVLNFAISLGFSSFSMIAEASRKGRSGRKGEITRRENCHLHGNDE